jgi:hypothetical protein
LKTGKNVAIQALWDYLEEPHFPQLMKVFITENVPGSELQMDARIQLEEPSLQPWTGSRSGHPKGD